MPLVPSTLKLVLDKTLPMVVGLFAIMLVQLVDSIFISMLGVDELTVHGITLPFQIGLIGLQVGIGVAATSIIAKAVGAGQFDSARMTATVSVIFGIAFVAIVCAALLWRGQDVFQVFMAHEDTQQNQRLFTLFSGYWPVWLVSAVSVAALYLVTCIYRANDDTKTTGTMFVVASVINLILDPILMFLLQMGVEGAAVASSVGYASSFGYMVFRARGKQWFMWLRLDVSLICHLAQLFRVTVPTTINQLLPAASALIGMILIAQLGTDAIAFWSLLSRIESFLLVFTLALTMSIPPMVGRYLGANQWEQMIELLLVTAKFLLAFHIAIALFVFATADLLIPFLSEDETLNEWLGFALAFLPLSYGPLGLCMMVVSVFNALGTPFEALKLSCVRLFVFYVPALWLGSFSGQMLTTVVAAMVANILAGMYAWFKLKAYIRSYNIGLQNVVIP